jgi:CrcB protein
MRQSPANMLGAGSERGENGVTIYLVVAAGGALGAVGRYVVISRTGALLGTEFPFGTVVVNVAGSFLLGLVVDMAAASGTDGTLLAFLGVGVLGGFTTFSTFALDVAFLAGRRAIRPAALYIAVSVVLSIAAFAAGLYLAHALA